MKPVLLFIAAIAAAISLYAADSSAAPAGHIDSILVSTPGTGWFLEIMPDGSGFLQYGSDPVDNTRFSAGSFDFLEVCGKLKSIAVPNRTRPGNDEGQILFTVHSGGESPHTYIGDKDRPYILQLFQQAVAKGRSHDPDRFDSLMKKYPFLLPK